MTEGMAGRWDIQKMLPEAEPDAALFIAYFVHLLCTRLCDFV